MPFLSMVSALAGTVNEQNLEQVVNLVEKLIELGEKIEADVAAEISSCCQKQPVNQ